MNAILKLIFFLVLTQFLLGHTLKTGDIWATLGPLLQQTHSTPSMAKEYNPPTLGAGLIANGDVDKNGGIEISLLYLEKSYLLKKDEKVLVEKIKRMQIGTGYRHWFVHWFSFGGSFFSSYSMGDPKVVYSDFERDENTKTTARKITEYGLDSSIQAEVFSGSKYSILAETRYAYSFHPKKEEFANVYTFLLACKTKVPKAKR